MKFYEQLTPYQRAQHFNHTVSHDQYVVTDYDKTHFPEFFNKLFDAHKVFLSCGADNPDPTYVFFETTEDIFNWETEHSDELKILPWEQQLEDQIRTANTAAHETGATVYYQGFLSPMPENPRGIELTLEALFLIDPTVHQVQAVQQHIGPLNERDLPYFMDDLRQTLLKQDGYTEFKKLLNQERIIAGVSWAWGNKAFRP